MDARSLVKKIPTKNFNYVSSKAADKSSVKRQTDYQISTSIRYLQIGRNGRF